MDKNTIMAALTDWNFWGKGLPTGIERKTYLDRLHALSQTNQVVVVTGTRRAGKSYIMRQMAHKLIKEGVAPKDTLIINLEDPRLKLPQENPLQIIFDVYCENLCPSAKPNLFLDEVHEAKNWEGWVRTAHELSSAKLVISGSNAKLLSKDISTIFTGRHLNIEILPLSFEEFLLFKGIEIHSAADKTTKRIEISRALIEYMEYGGFPEVAISNEKRAILISYFEDIVTRDLVRRYKVRKHDDLKRLAQFYACNPATPTTFRSIEKFLKLSVTTVKKFSGYLEEAYLIFFLPLLSLKFKEQQKSPRKVYPIDVGLANTAGLRTSVNTGRLAECIVFLELKRRQIQTDGLEIFYWKDANGREVDFVIRQNMEVSELIQVCWDMKNPETRQREIKPLLKAMDEFHLDKATIITGDLGETEIIDKKSIVYVPITEWLLS